MEPDANAHLLTVVEAVAARTEEARRRLDDLAARMDALERPPVVQPADPVRLAAIELAVGGAGRIETADRLADRFPGAELDAVLDDVFG
jgi:hypothetical protein